LPGASKGASTGGKARQITKRLLIKAQTFCLSENPLVAPANGRTDKVPLLEKVGKKLSPMRHNTCPKAVANW
jgi:hypothetical protein